jgi:hypothetical protein
MNFEMLTVPIQNPERKELTIPQVWKLLDAAKWMRDNNIPRIDGEPHDVYIARLQKIISDRCDATDRMFEQNESRAA